MICLSSSSSNVKVFIFAFMAFKDILGPKVVIAYVPPSINAVIHIPINDKLPPHIFDIYNYNFDISIGNTLYTI